MTTKIPFGSVERTELLDDDGSTKTTTTKYFANKVSRPVRIRYTIKQKVYSQKEEHEKLLKFSDENTADPSRLDPAVFVERSKRGDEEGYYFLSTAWTVLEY